MQVTKITSPADAGSADPHSYTQEQLQTEFNFMMAERKMRNLLERGLITEEEYKLITEENKKSFPTFLASVI
ncbi:MAG TPA: hypothetical protein DCG37_01010 [Lachnospiraceae bacterium]|nr:hypothetical protein [Lachnospiraceae bacterium]